MDVARIEIPNHSTASIPIKEQLLFTIYGALNYRCFCFNSYKGTIVIRGRL